MRWEQGPPSTPVRWRGLGRVVLAGVLVPLLIASGAWVTVDRYGASPVIVWLAADIGDIDRLSSRTIPTGPLRVDLTAGEPLGLMDVRSVPNPEGFLHDTGPIAFLIVQDGQRRCERYADGDTGEELRTWFSVAKSVVSALIGPAIDDGAIGSVDDPTTDFLPELLDADQRYTRITIRHQVTMLSGLGYMERFQGLPALVREAGSGIWGVGVAAGP